MSPVFPTVPDGMWQIISIPCLIVCHAEAMAPLDRISPLLERFRVRTRLFHTGSLCGVTNFPAQPGRGFLHILRRGKMEISHNTAGGRVERAKVDEPSLLFYPRPLDHAFYNAPSADSDFACAALEVEGSTTHPLLRALPEVVVLPLDAVDGLDAALDLLFSEIDNVACGRRIVADRLFEVILIQLFRWILDHPGQLSLPAGLLTGLTDERLARTLVAIHESPGRSWTLATMAREANMSRSTFAASFRDVVGQPPAGYLTDWRLTIAQDRLRAGAPVAITAAELGYASPSAFSRVFAQRIGRSPRAWLAEAT